jgi:uncharacterized protein YjbI with pentapeptide repeats
VDLSETLLIGAQLNGANLDGANVSGAILTNDPENGIHRAANLAGAYLRNVNLSNADLSGANLSMRVFTEPNRPAKAAATFPVDLPRIALRRRTRRWSIPTSRAPIFTEWTSAMRLSKARGSRARC